MGGDFPMSIGGVAGGGLLVVHWWRSFVIMHILRNWYFSVFVIASNLPKTQGTQKCFWREMLEFSGKFGINSQI